MGLQHSVYRGYGFEIPATTDFDALDEALAEQEPDRRVHHYFLGDFEQLFLLVAAEEVEENTATALTAADFARYEIPAWTAALHRVAVRLGHGAHPEPTWLVLHDHS
ncbi:hypothetical protein [Streptomyces silvensis]|uniref:Uncharacterized protein n=1 Tax=Streptomyces silvensis TaxID=1765722 RepID=A0A0W7X664_9ACTN|nr:hypothetical protein [Streptomyces silvensis]KUF18425.1 hypothetical protein AT728_18930 [Streptomyces silvensis]